MVRVNIDRRPAPVKSASAISVIGGVALRPSVTLRIVRPLVAVLRALLRRVIVVLLVLGAGAAAWGAEKADGNGRAGSSKAVKGVTNEPGTNAAASADVIRAAVARALPVLARGAEGHMAERKCFACHHQTFPLLALATAGRRGFEVDREYVERIAGFVERSLESGRTRYVEGRGQGGNTITAGSALWTLALAGRAPNETTRLVADYLAKAHQESVHWRVTTHRPPSEGSHFAATFVALRGLEGYGAAKPSAELGERLERVRSWLATAPVKDTEDRVFRLWGLVAAGADRGAIGKARDELLATQRADGGWAQLDPPGRDPGAAARSLGLASAALGRRQIESDAYATGTALVALRQAGVGPSDPAYQRGAAYLLKTQQADGTWRVKSRSKPIQTYFETGFPHGADQFISSAATSWAATALAMMLPVRVEVE